MIEEMKKRVEELDKAINEEMAKINALIGAKQELMVWLEKPSVYEENSSITG